MTGAQVKLLLEGLLDQSQEDARSTPQLSGVTATVDMSKPAGNRVVSLSLKPDRTYRIATLNRYTGWFRQTSGGDGDGKGSDLVEHPMTPIQAVEAFLARHRPYTPVKESRLIVLNVPAK
jgi:2',3'-cyclic-nucleotide 2'-phosphodiesterase (5'-nucleotidase family)